MKNAIIVNVPEWAKPAQADRYTLWEFCALMGIEDQYIKLSAADQRAIIGAAIFGKRAFKVSGNDGTVTVFRSVAFGADTDYSDYLPQDVRACVAQGLQLSAGQTGPRFFSL